MAKTVTCMFNNEAQAMSIVQRLEQSGIEQGKICLFSNSGNNRFWEGTGNFDQGTTDAGDDRVGRYLMDNGVPASDAHAYAEGVRRGHALVAVRCDDDEVDDVIDVLDGDDVLDIDERQENWRSEGWTGHGAGMTGVADAMTAGATGALSGDMQDQGRMQDRDEMDMRARMTDRDGMMADDGMAGDGMTGRSGDLESNGMREQNEVIPVAEEELHVGKREVNRGRVRIVSHVVERPVQEQVSLREEHVQVERRPVEGSMHTSAMGDGSDLFRERTIEVEEHGEEAVVSKEARVVEEVAVSKSVEQRNETVTDTVRKTEVEVQDERGNTVSRTGTTDDKR